MIVAMPKQFTTKDKPIIYFEAFIKYYNSKNYEQIHKIYETIKFKKIRILTLKNHYKLDTYYIVEISFVLFNAQIIPKI